LIRKNFFYQSIYRVVLLLVPLIVSPYISRVLGAERIGVYALTSSVASYFVLFAMLGIAHHGNRTIAAVRDDPEKLNKTFSNLLTLHIVVSLAAIAAYIVFIVLFTGADRMFFIAQAPVVVASLFNITWLFMGFEDFKSVTIRNVIVKTLTVICIFIFVRDRDDLWIYLLIMSLGSLFGQISVWMLIRRFVKFVKPTWGGVKQHIKPLLILFIPIVSMSVYNTLNRIMLGTIADNAELGFFSNSNRLISIAMGFIWALNSVLIPRIANLNAKCDEAGKQKLTITTMRYIMLLAFAMTFGIAAIAGDFAPIFFGSEFEGIGNLITGLCVMLPFMAFGNTLASQYIVPLSKDKAYSLSAVIAAIVSVVLNLVFIPLYGAMGAVIGIVSAESTRCIILTIVSGRALPIWIYIKNSIYFLLAGVAMFFIVQFIGNFLEQSLFSIFLQVVIGAVFYLSISAIYLYFSKDEVFDKLVIRRLFAGKSR